MEPDHAKNLLNALDVIKPPAFPQLSEDATDAQKQERDLYADATSHLANAIDCLKRSIAKR